MVLFKNRAKTLKSETLKSGDNNKENTRNLNRERLKRLVRVLSVAGQAVRRLKRVWGAFLSLMVCPILKPSGVDILSACLLSTALFTVSGQAQGKSIEKTDSMESKRTIPIYY